LLRNRRNYHQHPARAHVPFFVVPQIDWLFWGWLKAFVHIPSIKSSPAVLDYVQFTYGIIYA